MVFSLSFLITYSVGTGPSYSVLSSVFIIKKVVVRRGLGPAFSISSFIFLISLAYCRSTCSLFLLAAWISSCLTWSIHLMFSSPIFYSSEVLACFNISVLKAASLVFSCMNNFLPRIGRDKVFFLYSTLAMFAVLAIFYSSYNLFSFSRFSLYT